MKTACDEPQAVFFLLGIAHEEQGQGAGPIKAFSTPHFSFTSSSSRRASSMQSAWQMKTVRLSQPSPSSWSLDTRVLMAAFRPRALTMLTRWPSLSTWSTGLMLSMVPTRAVAALTRPPRFKYTRSSTVNQWAT